MAARWPNHAILRSSIIYGPDPPVLPVARPLFLQFIDAQLAAKVWRWAMVAMGTRGGMGVGCEVGVGAQGCI